MQSRGNIEELLGKNYEVEKLIKFLKKADLFEGEEEWLKIPAIKGAVSKSQVTLTLGKQINI